MRPVRLKMKAFGCYAEETSVDFEAFNGGLYLIVGKTGAGKTTVFDAISFALFGRPSGSERKTEMLHSDFVPLSEDTLVALDFTHRGRSYRVERKLHFQKKRGTTLYGDMKVSAVMTREGQTPIEGAERVTARCEELLGLNAEQFRRIVMLAQGEFREFLRSGSDKKNEILGRLFDNTEYVRYQQLLDSVRLRLFQHRREQSGRIEFAMEKQFRLPPEEAERQSEYLPGHPRLTENLRELAGREQELQKQLDSRWRKQSEESEALTRQEGAAETNNALLAELEEKRRHLSELEAQLPQVQAREREYLAAEKALHRVAPRERERQQAGAALNKALSDMGALEKLLTDQDSVCRKAQAAVDGDGPKKERTERLSGELSRLAELLPQYGELARSRGEREAARKELDAARRSMEAKQNARTAAAQNLEQLRLAWKALDGCEAEAARLDAERKEAKARRDAVSQPKKGLAAQTAAILSAEETLAGEEGKLSELTQTAARAEEVWHSLYRSFLDGQAGLIAAGMEKELNETGETGCPVCGTRFRRGEAHRFAISAERVPEQVEVDEAERRFKTAEAARRDKKSGLENRRNLLEERKKTVAEQLQKIEPDCGGWDSLCRPGWLDDLCFRLNTALREKEKDLAAAEEKCARRRALQAQEQDAAAALPQIEGQINEEKERCGALMARISGLDSAIKLMEDALPFPTAAEARARLGELEGEKKALDRVLDEHAKTLEEARGERDKTAGALRQLRDAVPGLEDTLKTAEERLALALTETGFADWSAAAAALSPVGGADAEQWLLNEQAALHDCAADRKNTRERVAALEVRTAGLQPVDLSELRDKLEAVKAGLGEIADAQKILDGYVQNHTAVLREVSEAAEDLARTERAFCRIQRLADMAVGVNSEGGKLSFDRYVMGAVFRQVLSVANYRLNIMTGGRFELIHSVDAGRKNAVAGLEIEVLDVASGKQRPSGSISGGEGFMVSLALALGLSDVVQSHAGGAKLDTLFIDEGFGTLDDGKLDNVITVLQQLTEGNRLVGIISHVDKLEESIPQKLRVKSTDRGSTLVSELS